MKTGTPVYLRDLNDSMREQEEKYISQSGNEELKKALEDGDDITIGHYLKIEEFEF